MAQTNSRLKWTHYFTRALVPITKLCLSVCSESSESPGEPHEHEDLGGGKAVRYCSKQLSIIFSDISWRTNYQYRLSIFWKPPIICQYGKNLPIIFDIERHPFNINCNRYIQNKLWAMSSSSVVIQLECDSKATQTDHVGYKLSWVR
jgi:hypothetical protein